MEINDGLDYRDLCAGREVLRRIESCYHCNVNTDSRSAAHSGRVVSYARYAIKRRAGISRGMNIDEHMSIHAAPN